MRTFGRIMKEIFITLNIYIFVIIILIFSLPTYRSKIRYTIKILVRTIVKQTEN